MTEPLEPLLVRELRGHVHDLMRQVADLERQNRELRGAVVALMEPEMPRVLRTPGGVMILDKK